MHPLEYLPYEDQGPPGLSLDGLSWVDDQHIRVDLRVSISPEELDFVAATVEVFDQLTEQALCSKSYEMNEWNSAHPEAEELDQALL